VNSIIEILLVKYERFNLLIVDFHFLVSGWKASVI